MLKRNGMPIPYLTAPTEKLQTQAEREVYKVIEGDLQERLNQIESVGKRLRELETSQSNHPTVAEKITTAPLESVSDLPGSWRECVGLLRQAGQDISLCSRDTNHGQEYAVVERYPQESAYAKAHGMIDVLNTGTDPRQVVCEYLKAEHETIQLLAQDTIEIGREIAQRQLVAEECNRVVEVLSEVCRERLSPGIRQSQAESISQEQTQQQGRGIRI